MLDESGFGASTEMGGFALDKGPELSLAPELFEYPSSLHQHWSEQLLNDPSQLLFLLCFPEQKSTNTTATPAAISSDPVFCLF